jgi:hypothetical protein
MINLRTKEPISYSGYGLWFLWFDKLSAKINSDSLSDSKMGTINKKTNKRYAQIDKLLLVFLFLFEYLVLNVMC